MTSPGPVAGCRRACIARRPPGEGGIPFVLPTQTTTNPVARRGAFLRFGARLIPWVLLAGCAPSLVVRPGPRPGEDPFDKLITLRVDSGRVVSRALTDIPASAYHPALRRGLPVIGRSAAAVERVHPLLRGWLTDSLQSPRAVRVLVTFRDTLRMPRFPEPRTDLPRRAPENVVLMARADSIVRAIRTARDREYAKLLPEFTGRARVQILQSYWITKSVLLEGPVREIARLIGFRDATYFAPDRSGERPPDCGTCPEQRCDLPWHARQQIHTDFYRDMNLDYGWMSLFDTGVQSTHDAFASAPGAMDHPPLVVLGDCMSGTTSCTGTDPGDHSPVGHGTSSAAILVGHYNEGGDACRKGVTNGVLDAFRVYGPDSACSSPEPGLSRSAVLLAFQHSLPLLDRVIIAEMQALGSDGADISAAADQAFDAGAAVIAAQGNCGSATAECPEDGKVKSPANAHYAIGVGSYDVKFPVTPGSNNCPGPTTDLRIKPDVLGPNATLVAARDLSAPFTAEHTFSGTSGATPYVAGAAALLRNFLGQQLPVGHDAGYVYSALILSGRDPWITPGSGGAYSGFKTKCGAGPIELPSGDFTMWAGEAGIVGNEGYDVFLDFTPIAGATTLEAAIWWPDFRQTSGSGFIHSWVDLMLEAPDGSTFTGSDHNSVFQRITAPVTAANRGLGRLWRLWIIGRDVPIFTGVSQRVYYTAVAR